jgi:hypothetical protein
MIKMDDELIIELNPLPISTDIQPISIPSPISQSSVSFPSPRLDDLSNQYASMVEQQTLQQQAFNHSFPQQPFQGSFSQQTTSLPQQSFPSAFTQRTPPLQLSPPPLLDSQLPLPQRPLKQVQPFYIDDEDEEQTEHDMIVWMKQTENQQFLIHAIADVILFYVSFQYIRSSYHHTEVVIRKTREQLFKMQKQYGLKMER